MADYNEHLISQAGGDGECPQSEFHGNPFRYCSCGWMEESPVVELTDSEKLEFLYQVALKADKALNEIMPQVEPLLKGLQSNPMLRMFLK